MGLMDSSSIQGVLDVIGFGKIKGILQSNKAFPYDNGYISSSDVYAVVSYIAGKGKDIPWILKLEKNGEVETVTSGELYDLIQQPNRDQSREEFVDMALTFLLLSGEVFEHNLDAIGFEGDISTVNLLNPQFVGIETIKVGFKYKPKKYTYQGVRETIPVEEVTHIKYANPTKEGERTLRGLSPLVAGYLTVLGLNRNQEANATILEHQGAAGILSNESDRILTGDERKQEQSMLDTLIAGVKNFGKIIQSSTKIKYTRLGLDPTQLKLIETKLLKARDLNSIYHVRSILFNDTVNASFRNLEVAEKAAYIDAILPNLGLIINMFTRGVVNKFNEKEFPNGKGRYFIEPGLSKIAVLQADLKKEAEKDKIKMEGISTVLTMPIAREGKIELLVSEYNYTEENATIITTPLNDVQEG